MESKSALLASSQLAIGPAAAIDVEPISEQAAIGRNGALPLEDERLVTDSQARVICGNVSAMCFWRWDRDPKLTFPKPVIINKRKYRRLGELRRWLAVRAAAGKVG